ncbi:MAG: 1-acyl-sn-glycerol-3-phosphate acyltransferase [Ignavibacteria bacterium]|nr:1-acyl-sn-glycerol-3-phosphate acyltransferase [Ignavibacteria bacterium]
MFFFQNIFLIDFRPQNYRMVRSFFRIFTILVHVFFVPAVILLFLPFDKKRNFYKAASKFFGKQLVKIAGIQLEIVGRENIDFSVPHIYISNHASMFDIPCVLAGIPDNIGFVYKQELHWIPFFGLGLRYGKIHTPIHRTKGMSAMESLDVAAQRIKNGGSILLFAEGTRTKDGKLQSFKRGPFYLAVRSGVPVIPLTINGTFKILPKKSFRIQSGNVTLILGKPISIPQTQDKDAEKKLMEEVHKAIEEHYVEQ